MSDESDNRRSKRAGVRLAVRYRTSGSFLVSYSLNLSKGGLFLGTEDFVPVGTKLVVALSVPGVDEPIETGAEVVWVRDQADDHTLPRGLGLRFEGLEERIGETIDALVRDFSGVTLMAVAQDEMALKQLGRYLRSALHCQVTQTTTEEFINRGIIDLPDLVLIELTSRDAHGLATLERLKAFKPSIPVVALAETPELLAEATARSADASLSSPAAFVELRQCLLDVLSRPASGQVK